MFPLLVSLVVGWYVAKCKKGRAKLPLSYSEPNQLGRSLALPLLVTIY